MRPGDRIAIKSSYTRKHGLPFDSRGQAVSVLAIKAIGAITENLNDGKRVKVDWTMVEPVREWYFYTHRGTVWRVLPGEWMTDGLIAFAFDSKSQDVDRFRNAPYWRERFGTVAPDKHRFGWTKFYEAIAAKLLTYRANRAALVEGVREISGRVDGLGHLAEDKYADGTTGFVKDICPFTTMGLFNRGAGWAHGGEKRGTKPVASKSGWAHCSSSEAFGCSWAMNWQPFQPMIPTPAR